MAPINLPCSIGGECDFQTIALEYDQAKDLLQLHMQHTHPVTMPGGGVHDKFKPEKFPRPTLELDSTAETWADFRTTWNQYKMEYNLEGPGLIRQLHACCAAELKTSLSRLTGGKQFDSTEDELLAYMKQLAVRHQNPAVNVQEFLQLSQQPDEGVKHYLMRL